MTRILHIAIILIAFSQTTSAKMISVSPSEVTAGSTVTFDVRFQDQFYKQNDFFNSASINLVKAKKFQVVNENHLLLTFDIPDDMPIGNWFLEVSFDDIGKPLMIKINPKQQLSYIKNATPFYFKEGGNVDITINTSGTLFLSDSVGIVISNTYFPPLGEEDIIPLKIKALTDTTLLINVNLYREERFYNITVYSKNKGIMKYNLAIRTDIPALRYIKSLSPTFSTIGTFTKVTVSTANTKFKMDTIIEAIATHPYASPNEKYTTDSVRVLNDTLVEVYFNFSDSMIPGPYHILLKNKYEYASGANYQTKVIGNYRFILFDKAGVIPEVVDFFPKTVTKNDTEDITVICRGIKIGSQNVGIEFKGYSSTIINGTKINDSTFIAPLIISRPYGDVELKVNVGRNAMIPKELLKIRNANGNIPVFNNIYPQNCLKGDSVTLRLYYKYTKLKSLSELYIRFNHLNGGSKSFKATILSDTLLECRVKFEEAGVYSIEHLLLPSGFELSRNFIHAVFNVLPLPAEPQIVKVNGTPNRYGTFNLEIVTKNTDFPIGGSRSLEVSIFSTYWGYTISLMATKIMVNSPNVLNATFTADSFEHPLHGDYTLSIQDYSLSLYKQNIFSFYNTGIDNKINSAENEIAIFPVPTSDVLSIATSAKIDAIEITDVFGRVATIANWDTLGDRNTIDLKKYNINHGVYFIRIQIGKESVYRKIYVN
ncbi:MAG: T9SS C-terminal target domain-containing protein [Bacteroidetes bacterium]|nr:MAG: T9SS C-terminal target domain-containing protein [Bacteroidota bacterium]